MLTIQKADKTKDRQDKRPTRKKADTVILKTLILPTPVLPTSILPTYFKSIFPHATATPQCAMEYWLPRRDFECLGKRSNCIWVMFLHHGEIRRTFWDLFYCIMLVVSCLAELDHLPTVSLPSGCPSQGGHPVAGNNILARASCLTKLV